MTDLRKAAEKLLPFLWETNLDEEIETEYEQAVVDLRDALAASPATASFRTRELHIPEEVVREICADVLVGTYGYFGNLTQTRIDVANSIDKWLADALLSEAEPQPPLRMNVPGIIAKHAIITPVCRENRTPYGAFFEAMERLRDEYLECCKIKENENANYHLVLSVEFASAEKLAGEQKDLENGLK